MKYSLTGLALSAGAFASSLPVHIETREPLTSHLANIHVRFAQPTTESLTFTYGSCTASSPSDAHHTIATTDSVRVSRLAWAIPVGIHDKGCISAWKRDGSLVGRSDIQKLHRVKRRAPQKRDKDSIVMTEENGFNVLGPSLCYFAVLFFAPYRGSLMYLN